MTAHVQEAVQSIRRRWQVQPVAGIVLGTGMADLVSELDIDVVIDYGDIPHFPLSTALGHKGRLVCGTLAGAAVVVMDGRVHVYEGYSLAEITLPIRVLHALGARSLILSNAAGGLNPRLAAGDIVVIDDHINLMGACSLSVAGMDRTEWRAGKESSAYDRHFIEQALAVSREINFAAGRGVYVSMSGPNYETRAEYRFLRRIGADVVGMSTVPEVIIAALCGMRTLALSTVTNVCRPDAPLRVTGDDVLHAAERAEPHVRKIVAEVVAELAKQT